MHRIFRAQLKKASANHIISLLFLISILFFFGSSCMRNTNIAQSPFDNPDHHYRLGIQQIKNGDVEASKKSFSRAKALRHDFALADVGLALAALTQNEFHSAEKHIAIALRQDRKCFQAHIAAGKLKMLRGIESKLPGNDWIQNSLKSFNQALKLSKNNPEILYNIGEAYLASGNLNDSQIIFKSILNLNKELWSIKARKRLKFAQEIVRYAPGSTIGKQIGLKAEISRAEMAILLIEELKLYHILEEKDTSFLSNHINSEVASSQHMRVPQHWANGWVNLILEIGVPGLGLFPDGDYHHDQDLSRVSCALIISFLIDSLSEKPKNLSAHFGEVSTFPDLKSDHYAYPASSIAVKLGLLNVKNIRTGNFDPLGPVSGLEALGIIRRIQDEFRIEF